MKKEEKNTDLVIDKIKTKYVVFVTTEENLKHLKPVGLSH